MMELSRPESRLKERLMLYSLSLGLSFGILVVFIGDLEALVIVLILVTAAVVAANTADLRELEKDRGLLVFVILCAFFTIGASYYISQVFVDVFVPLVGLDIAALVGYVLMKRMPRYNSESDERSF